MATNFEKSELKKKIPSKIKFFYLTKKKSKFERERERERERIFIFFLKKMSKTRGKWLLGS